MITNIRFYMLIIFQQPLIIFNVSGKVFGKNVFALGLLVDLALAFAHILFWGLGKEKLPPSNHSNYQSFQLA